MSDEEAVWNADMLSLAVLSEHSCAAEYRRAGKAVLELFPQWMVKKERESFKNGKIHRSYGFKAWFSDLTFTSTSANNVLFLYLVGNFDALVYTS